MSFAEQLRAARLKGNGAAAAIAHAVAVESGKVGLSFTADEVLADHRKAELVDSAVRDDAVRRAVAAARVRLGCDTFTAPPYPVDALGPLAPAARALAAEGQLGDAMAGQSLLGAAALLAQSRADVETLEARKPISLYLLTVAESGAGKTAAESVALRPIRELQREESARHRAAVAASAGDAPPRAPYRIGANATVEGIRRDFAAGVPSQGVFTSEGAAILSGYGMRAEHRAKSAAEFNALFDRGDVSVSRALAGRIELHDRRLSLHWQIQPAAARDTMHDPLLAAMGYWPRFLIAWPQPGAPRVAKPFHADQHQPIRDYWQRSAELLAPLGDDCAGLPVVRCNGEAHKIMCAFFERMERAAHADGSLSAVRPFALRATELAHRVAAVLAVYEGRDHIAAADARSACALVVHSIETWAQIFGDRRDADGNASAVALYEWLARRSGATATDILQLGPRCVRTKDSRAEALARLSQAGLALHDRDTGRWLALGVMP